MTNYNDGDDEGDNVGNRDGDDNNNAASISGSDGLIFNIIKETWSHGV